MPIYKGSGLNPVEIKRGTTDYYWVYQGSTLKWEKETISSEFIFTVSLIGETEITLPLLDGYTYDFTVDWGDGSSLGTVTSYNDTDAVHTYSAGTYDITINGTCQCFRTYTYSNPYDQLDESVGNIAQYISEIKQWGTCDFLTLSFAYCFNLTSIPNLKITGANNVTDLRGLFSYTMIDIIPSGLLDNCIKVNNVAEAFCVLNSVTSIPTGLFDNNPLITSFINTFSGTSISSIPNGLFDNCTEVTNFSQCFFNCESLTSIPSGLFDNCTEVTDFSSCFGSCKITSIPSGLFDNCTEVTNFSQCFIDCVLLTSIPSGLFDNHAKVINFQESFFNCESLTSIPSGLFDNCTEVTNFRQCFIDCVSLDGNAPELWLRVPEPDGNRCFYNCTGLDNYNDIPSDWK